MKDHDASRRQVLLPTAEFNPEPLNWPHLILLLALPAYALLTWHWGWSHELTLAAGTLLALAWLMLCERLRPGRADWQANAADMRRDASSLGLAALVDTLFSLGANLVALAWREYSMVGGAQAGVSLLLQQGWQILPLPIALILVIAVGEFLPYWLHRWAHERPALWRWHALHHWPTAVNTSNSVLVHPFNLLWNKLGRWLPWFLLQVPADLMLWAALFIQAQELAAHANVAGSLRGLRVWLGGAEPHRWHHSVLLNEAGNYGTVVPWWDWVFGSRFHPIHQGPAHVGWAAGSWRPERLHLRELICGPLPGESRRGSVSAGSNSDPHTATSRSRTRGGDSPAPRAERHRC
ncbi:sterol desaturase family protein [Paucibacter sp. AS339]|uniref:sterol desaturase family protein n=1 Tax=Paucibacter hankyongi TaxID=3133434 RepID=UPI00309D0A06